MYRAIKDNNCKFIGQWWPIWSGTGQLKRQGVADKMLCVGKRVILSCFSSEISATTYLADLCRATSVIIPDTLTAVVFWFSVYCLFSTTISSRSQEVTEQLRWKKKARDSRTSSSQTLKVSKLSLASIPSFRCWSDQSRDRWWPITSLSSRVRIIDKFTAEISLYVNYIIRS